eukprot:m.126560 g.126560  ORF g.126560 m.126560 type:complete len:483 (+) comp9708_c0_seq3:132-1580(+)
MRGGPAPTAGEKLPARGLPDSPSAMEMRRRNTLSRETAAAIHALPAKEAVHAYIEATAARPAGVLRTAPGHDPSLVLDALTALRLVLPPECPRKAALELLRSDPDGTARCIQEAEAARANHRSLLNALNSEFDILLCSDLREEDAITIAGLLGNQLTMWYPRRIVGARTLAAYQAVGPVKNIRVAQRYRCNGFNDLNAICIDESAANWRARTCVIHANELDISTPERLHRAIGAFQAAAELARQGHFADTLSRAIAFVLDANIVSTSAAAHEPVPPQLPITGFRRLNIVFDIDATLLSIAPTEASSYIDVTEVRQRDVAPNCFLRPGLPALIRRAAPHYNFFVATAASAAHPYRSIDIVSRVGGRSWSMIRCVDKIEFDALGEDEEKNLSTVVGEDAIASTIVLDDKPYVWRQCDQPHVIPVLPFSFAAHKNRQTVKRLQKSTKALIKIIEYVAHKHKKDPLRPIPNIVEAAVKKFQPLGKL